MSLNSRPNTCRSGPQMRRILATTACVPDLDAAEAAYTAFLYHRRVEHGVVTSGLAQSWGAPAQAGARYVLLQAVNEEDSFTRLVQSPPVAGYAPLVSYGWSAFELILDDVPAVAARLASSPFQVIGAPKALRFLPSIVAMQVVGPGGEVLYLTMESGDRNTSILPLPSGPVGRTFIAVCAGPDFDRMRDWYVASFALQPRSVRRRYQVDVVQRAQNLGPEQYMTLGTLGLGQPGNFFELDSYPHGEGLMAGPRPRNRGMLPPGNAMVSIEVEDIAALLPLAGTTADHIREEEGALYAGRRHCTVSGPAGELVELLESH